MGQPLSMQTVNQWPHPEWTTAKYRSRSKFTGAVLIDTDAIVKIADRISPQDFFDARHARIYEALTALYEKRSAIDVLTLADQLKGTGFLDMVGGPAYLAELTNFVPTASHVEQYADIVAGKANAPPPHCR